MSNLTKNRDHNAAFYGRYSSDLQRKASIEDQLRKCREKAEQNGHVIPPELEFKDEAISGTKRDRDGLNALETAVKTGQVTNIYVHSLSRFARETTIIQTLIKDLVCNYDARIICVTEGIDTVEPKWKMNLGINAILHEEYIADLAANVFRGQEGIVIAGNAVGDHCFGYSTEAIPSEDTTQQGRDARPKKRYIIHSEKAEWVKRIFDWFVNKRWSIRRITRELNRLGAPMDHRARSGSKWRHQYVARLLRNRKYIGEWAWGQQQNVRNPLNGITRQKNRPAEETAKWVRQFPDLRIIDDETFAKAQEFLKQNRQKYTANRKKRKKGNKSTSGDGHPRHLLSHLVVCSQCDSTLLVGGKNGKYLYCPSHHLGTCECQTQLRRDLAERMILDAIGERILENPVWREEVLQETLKAWEVLESTVPSELKTARQRLAAVDKKIDRLVDLLEDGQDPALKERLAQRHAEKRELADRVKRLEAVERDRPPKPTEAWVDVQLGKLSKVLHKDTPAAAYALRDLVGGKIVVTEASHPASKRLHLLGRFTVRVGAIVKGLVGVFDACEQSPESDPDELSEEFVIDFREEPTLVAQSEQAKELYDKGMMNALIAEELGCNRSYVTKLLTYWFESRGLEMPDGRSRRASLNQKHLEPPLYQVIADAVMAMYREKALLQEIADVLDVDRNTITSAIRYWHESRGLPVPDGRTRRKELDRKCSDRDDV